MKFPLGCAAAAATIGFVASSGCMTRAQRVSWPSARPAADSTAQRPEAAGASGLAPESPGPFFDPAQVTSTLDDPALVAVKACVSLGDYANAYKALEKALSSSIPPIADQMRWRYQLGRLRTIAGDLAGAAEAFDEVAKSESPLAPYARFGAAQALLRAGHVDEALARARAFSDDVPLGPQVRLLIAEALQLKHELEPAIEIWQAYLGESHHPPRWIEVALRMAEALMDGHPSSAQAEKAALLARRVEVEAPTSSAVARALELERRALVLVAESQRIKPVMARGKGGAVLPSDWARALSYSDQLARANALVEAQSYQEAQKALEALAVALGPKATTTEVGCQAQTLLGSLLGKLKDRARAADAYGLAITRCEGYRDTLVEALYFGGKASSSAGRCDEAMERFARVEKDFHDHRYADDARLHAAECALELGDEKRYTDMLSAMAADYSEGDMVGEALFRLALRRMVRKDWAFALRVFETAKNLRSKEMPSSTRGRLAYFEARALYASGDVAGGRRAFAEVIRDYPLSYYMLQAYARLSEDDPAEAKAVLEGALAAESPGKFVIEDDELFHTPGFTRALELLRQGESDFARRELAKLGVSKDGASPRALWAVAACYARVGLFQASHAYPKFRVFDWLSHYPVGQWKGAWEIAYPRAFSDVVDREAKKNGIPPTLAYAVMREESAFDPEAVSPARAFGLMQLIVPTAKKVARDVGIACDESLLARPETNVALGCRFLADLRARFPNSPHLAVSAYNAGPGAPARWIATRESDDFDLWVEQIPYDETRRYTKRVLASYAAYSFLYDRSELSHVLTMPKVAP